MRKELDYTGLSNDERFQLVTVALARGDKADAERLFTSCPRKTYSELDIGFTDKTRDIYKMVAAFVSGLQYQFGKLDGLSIAGDLRCLVPDEDEVRLAIIDRWIKTLEQIIVERTQFEYEVFDSICKEFIGVDAETVLKAVAADNILTTYQELPTTDDPEVIEALEHLQTRHPEEEDEREAEREELTELFREFWKGENN